MTAQYLYQPDEQKGNIPALAGFRSFGALLFFLRENNGYSQMDLVEAVEPFLRSRKKPILERRMYGRLEKDERFPAFHELEPIYRALVEGLEIAISDAERELYVRLAQNRLEEKRKQKENLRSEDWANLAKTLAEVQHPKRRLIRLLERETLTGRGEHPDAPTPTLRRISALQDILLTDTSHLLEREFWVRDMQAYLAMTPAKKLVVIQGAMGIGKSHALALLAKRFQEQGQEESFLLPYRFSISESKTADDQFAVFLSTLLADLQQTTPDEAKQMPLEQIIDQVLAALRKLGEAGKKFILLLDDAQALFPSPREWAAGCEQFFLRFIREPHTATIYLFTRIWPGWPDRRLTYIAEKELPALSPQAGSIVWQHSGFDDVPQALLEQASIRCGGNPQLMEMRAFHQLGRGGTAFAWNRATLAGGQLAEQETHEQKNANTRLIEEFLTQDSLFDSRLDIKAKQTLQGVITSQLSHPTVRVLECLSLSPLGLPFALLEQEFPAVDVALDELVRASLLDLNMATAHRASIVPLVREAQMQMLATDGRKAGIEQRVTDLYAYWLTSLQEFRDDHEKAALIAEMVVRYIRQRQLLKAAELFVSFGWLCTLFGHITRIQRVFDEMVKEDRGKDEDVKHEVGRLILRHRIAVHAVHSGQQVERDERDQIYRSIYEKVVAGEVVVEPHTELEVLHNMLLFYSRKGRLLEASSMFDGTLERLQHLGKITPEVYALFLFDKGRLMSYRADKERQLDASLKFTQASVNCVKECIANWRLCLKNALPLQEYYVQFKLARALNDLACDLRTLKQYSDAQEAIEESIKLKKKTGTPPYSIATALSEHSQILAARGKIREALSINEEAKKMLEQSIADGDNMHNPELGLILKERANIFLLQARLTEAKPLLEQAIELMGDKPLRQKDKERAKAQIEEIQLVTSSSQLCQLDRRWFSRLSDLVDFNDTQWLTQAGPFNEEEMAEWKRLSSQEDEQSSSQMSKLIAQSKKREFARSLEEKCEPTFHYPYLPLEDVRVHISGLTALRGEIETQEANMIVRRLYLDTIDEHLAFLHLCEAIALQDKTTAMQCNLQLYGKPSEREMKIALQQLCNMLLDAHTHELASPVAQEALAQLEEWGISPHKIVAEDLFIPTFGPIQQQVNHKLLASEKKAFSTTTIRKFFQDVLAMYGENNWNVYVNPARDHTTVDPNIRELILPEKSFSVQKVRQLLAEEIETHSYRAIAGRNSSLALLGSGLANHLAADEGLAYHYVQSVNSRVYGEYEEKKWNATLTTGFASGVLTHALSFPELRGFLEKMFLVSELLDDVSWEAAFEFARQAAWRRCCRVFRGAGCVSLKDRVYLQGHLEISDYLARGGEELHLYVGCIGVDHLEDMAELGILAPSYPHQHLALATDLAERLASYEK